MEYKVFISLGSLQLYILIIYNTTKLFFFPLFFWLVFFLIVFSSYYFCDTVSWTCSGQSESQVGNGWVDCVDEAPVQAPIPVAAYTSVLEPAGGKHSASAYFIGGGLIAVAVIAVASVFAVILQRRSRDDGALMQPLVAAEPEL